MSIFSRKTPETTSFARLLLGAQPKRLFWDVQVLACLQAAHLLLDWAKLLMDVDLACLQAAHLWVAFLKIC